MKNLKNILIAEMRESLLKNGYRELIKNDWPVYWFGLAGAERFEDGSEPLVKEIKCEGYGDDLMSLFDANGVTLLTPYDADYTGLFFENQNG